MKCKEQEQVWTNQEPGLAISNIFSITTRLPVSNPANIAEPTHIDTSIYIKCIAVYIYIYIYIVT